VILIGRIHEFLDKRSRCCDSPIGVFSEQYYVVLSFENDDHELVHDC